MNNAFPTIYNRYALLSEIKSTQGGNQVKKNVNNNSKSKQVKKPFSSASQNKSNNEPEQQTHVITPYKHQAFVLKGLDPNTNTKNIKDYLEAKCNLKIFQVYMLKTGAGSVFIVLTDPSLTLTYMNENIKSILNLEVHWEHQLTDKRLIQCFNCQAWGHIVSNCNRATKCRKCAGRHKSNACTTHYTLAKCANCGGGHYATSPSCQIYKRQVEMLEKKTQNPSGPGKYVAPQAPKPIVWTYRSYREPSTSKSTENFGSFNANPPNQEAVKSLEQQRSIPNQRSTTSQYRYDQAKTNDMQTTNHKVVKNDYCQNLTSVLPNASQATLNSCQNISSKAVITSQDNTKYIQTDLSKAQPSKQEHLNHKEVQYMPIQALTIDQNNEYVQCKSIQTASTVKDMYIGKDIQSRPTLQQTRGQEISNNMNATQNELIIYHDTSNDTPSKLAFNKPCANKPKKSRDMSTTTEQLQNLPAEAPSTLQDMLNNKHFQNESIDGQTTFEDKLDKKDIASNTISSHDISQDKLKDAIANINSVMSELAMLNKKKNVEDTLQKLNSMLTGVTDLLHKVLVLQKFSLEILPQHER